MLIGQCKIPTSFGYGNNSDFDIFFGWVWRLMLSLSEPI
jgi:hypothetical protein